TGTKKMSSCQTFRRSGQTPRRRQLPAGRILNRFPQLRRLRPCTAFKGWLFMSPRVMQFATSRAGRNLTAAGSDDERSQGGRHVPNHAPTVPSSVLDQDIAGRQHNLRAIVEFECHVAGEKDPEIRRVGLVKAVVSSTGFVALLEVH